MDYTNVELGMYGGPYTDAINSNFEKTKTKISEIDTSLGAKPSSTNIKAFKVENGSLMYTLDNTTWIALKQVAWGNIIGLLSSQTDISDALAGKASASELSSLSSTVGTVSSTVSSLGTTVSKNTTDIATNKSSIGTLQTSVATKVSSATIKSFRISASGFLEYSLNGTTWITVQSLSSVSWGAIEGEISNQEDLMTMFASKANASIVTSHTGNKNNPHEVTKSQVGLANVDNTADVDKPVSTAQQTAIDGLQTSINTLGTSKVTNVNGVTGIEKLDLNTWNARKDAGTLLSTVLYIVEE